jgi:hypothetical protein
VTQYCPVHSTLPSKVSSLQECVCDAGYTGPAGGPPCTPAVVLQPTSANINFEPLNCVTCVAGFYLLQASLNCTACPEGSITLLGDGTLPDTTGSRHRTLPGHVGVGGHHTTVRPLFFIAYPQTRVPAPSVLGPCADATVPVPSTHGPTAPL